MCSKRRSERRNKLVRQRLKEQFPDQRDMARRGRDDDVHPFLGQDRIGRPAVVFRLDAFGEATFAQSPHWCETRLRSHPIMRPDR